MMRFRYFLLLVVAALFSLSACNNTEAPDDGKISVVCTAFPQYDWVREIVGENSGIFDITYITDNGTDMHSYQPTADDIIKISDCDILISVGGTSEGWIDDAVKNNPKSERVHLKLMDLAGDSIMHVGENHGHSADEHVWLSLKHASVFCKEICSENCKRDRKNEEYYSENAERYIQDLNYIDKVAEEFIASSPRDTVIFADRFPFRYTLHDYGIKYCAAFEGCSSDSEVTFDTVIHLSEMIDNMDIKAILVTDDSDGKIAEAVISNTNNIEIEIYKLNSMQSVSAADVKNGMRYIEVMRDNLALIHGALIV